MRFIALVLVSLAVMSCSTNSNNTYSVDNNLQISHLDSELMHIESMLSSARARKTMNQNDPTDINNSMIDGEIMNYESQRASVLARKNALQMQNER